VLAQADDPGGVNEHIESGSAIGAKPEKLRVSCSPLKRVKIAGVEKLKLLVACWVEAMLDHENAPRN
jgi:hypothetical protein